MIVKPVSLGNVNIIRSLSEYRGNNIRTIEQAELAIIVSRAHFKVGTPLPILASLQRLVYKVTQIFTAWLVSSRRQFNEFFSRYTALVIVLMNNRTSQTYSFSKQLP